MGRPPADDPRDYMLTVRLTDAEKRKLDAARGRTPISKFVRRLIRRELGGNDLPESEAV